MGVIHLGSYEKFNPEDYNIICEKTCKKCIHSENPTNLTGAKIKCKFKLNQLKYSYIRQNIEFKNDLGEMDFIEKEIGWHCKSFKVK